MLRYAATAAETSALIGAVSWIEQLLLGSLATLIAVLMFALIGLTMLQGRISFRQALQVVLGCFVLFGAPALASGIVTNFSSTPSISGDAPSMDLQLPKRFPEFDPYAGAAVPVSEPMWP